MKKNLTHKIKTHYIMKLETGLHIGGSKGAMEIGGVDDPVIKNPLDLTPYIPGSSLKGKMRSLLEFSEGKEIEGSRHECKDENCNVCNSFGSAKGDLKRTGKIIFRDSFITEEWKKKLNDEIDTELLYTENKAENTIDRIKGQATPRNMERVPAGVEFDVNIVLTIFDNDYNTLIEILKKGIDLLELDYLGGSGTRGSGQVSFKLKDVEIFKTYDESNEIKKEQIVNILKK